MQTTRIPTIVAEPSHARERRWPADFEINVDSRRPVMRVVRLKTCAVNHLASDISADFRLTACLLAGGSVLLPECEIDYLPLLRSDRRLLPGFFELYLESYPDRTQAAEEWLRSICDQDYESNCEPDGSLPQDTEPWKHAVLEFTQTFSSAQENNTLFDVLIDYGSGLEQVYATLLNVLAVDEAGIVTNKDAAFRRTIQAAQMMAGINQPTVPPFERWEVELHI